MISISATPPPPLAAAAAAASEPLRHPVHSSSSQFSQHGEQSTTAHTTTMKSKGGDVAFANRSPPPSGGQLEYKICIPGATYLCLSSNPSTRRRIALEGRHGPINYHYSKAAHWENKPGCPSADLRYGGTDSKSIGGLEIQLKSKPKIKANQAAASGR